jgi:hypothetical protein
MSRAGTTQNARLPQLFVMVRNSTFLKTMFAGMLILGFSLKVKII